MRCYQCRGNRDKARGILTAGAGRNPAEAAKPLIIEKNGVKLAILNFCENEFGGARKDTPGANTLDLLVNIEQIKAAKQLADTVLVAVHGGHENYPYPSPRMVKTYRAFAEAGADAVWNCHTHCPGGYELWKGVPIIYSPGNFYFPPRPTSIPVWKYGYITEFLFDENGVYGYELTPYGFDLDRIFPVEQPYLTPADQYLVDLCKPLKDPELLQSLFDSWTAKSGVSYMGMVNNTGSETYPPDWSDPAVIEKWIGVRNLFTCESHADLLRNLGFMIEERRVQEAADGFERIVKMQKPDFIKW